jgi:hypothetical protein
MGEGASRRVGGVASRASEGDAEGSHNLYSVKASA